MSDYGADKNADLNIATDTTKVDALMPFDKTFVSQHTYDAGVLVHRYASRNGKSNLLIKFET